MQNDLAFKYRPHIYDDVVGNEKIVNELKKRTIDQNFPKTVLFLGTTGIGKTTLARIYAKSLLCRNIKDGNPCNICEYCEIVNREQSTEYITFYNGGEFGVDQASELINMSEKKILGRKGIKKIFMIDELQSIKSKVAEEKLLKILEREHDNCYYIFGAMRWDNINKALKGRARNATYKLNLNYKEIRERLIYIVKAEKINVTDEFAKMVVTIADNCGNSLRDGIGLLESLVYRKIETSEELFKEFDILASSKVDELIIKMLEGDIYALEYGITEELYKKIIQKLSLLYRHVCGLKLNWWQENQVKGILKTIDKHYILTWKNVISSTINELNELYKYRYLTDLLIENYFITVIENNKNRMELAEKPQRMVRK